MERPIWAPWRMEYIAGPKPPGCIFCQFPAAPEADLAARAFYPMTLPLTVGPGSISVAITLGAQAPRGVSAWAITIVGTPSG